MPTNKTIQDWILSSPYLDQVNGTYVYKVRELCDALTISRKEFQEYLADDRAMELWNSSNAQPIPAGKANVEQKLDNLLLLHFLSRMLQPDDVSLKYWMRLPNPYFNGESPMKLVLRGDGESVFSQLEAIHTGNVVA